MKNQKSKIKNQKSTKSWQHRIGSTPADPVAEAFVESLSFDHRLLPYDIQGSIAHATMLAKVKLITAKDLAAIKRGLLAILKDYQAGKLELDPAFEDIHMVVEAELIRRVGEPGRRLHTARSRNDQVALDIRLWLDAEGLLIIRKIQELQRELCNASERNLNIIMPAYTHLQQAQPICAGAYFMSYVEALNMDLRRNSSSRTKTKMPLGSGAVAGTTLPISRIEVAKWLEYNTTLPPTNIKKWPDDTLSKPDHEMLRCYITSNSIHATAGRDFIAEFVFACAQTMVTLSRMAEDFIIWMTQEFSYLEMGDAYTTGSSMMPQKRNPDMLELIRGKAALVIGNVTQILTLQKGLPMAYNRDLQEDKRILFAAYDQTAASLEMMTRMVRTVRLNQAAINQHIDKGFIDATALSEYFVFLGIPFRTAHQIVGSLVRECVAARAAQKPTDPCGSALHRLRDLPLEAFGKACQDAGVSAKIIRKIDRRLYDWLGPENVVKKYQSYGSAGVDSCKEQIKYWRDRLS